MSPQPRLVYEHPNLENTLVFTEYQASSPENFSLHDDDKFVLYGGGTNFKLKFLDRDQHTKLHIDKDIQLFGDHVVELFVLNCSFIIWCSALNKGIEFPYQTILVHALQHPDTLYLQIVDNELLHVTKNIDSEFDVTVQLEISASDVQIEYPCEFNILTKVPNTVASIYEAMSRCSGFHFDSDTEDPGHGFDFEHSSLNPNFHPSAMASAITLNNLGNADDLEDLDDADESPEEAGMNVDVGYGPIAGVVRKRESDDNEFKKARRL